MVKTSRLLWVGQRIAAALVFNRDEALLDIDVRRAGNIVGLGKNRVPSVDHRIWRAALLAEMHHRLGLELAHHRLKKRVIAQIADEWDDRAAGDCAPNP